MSIRRSAGRGMALAVAISIGVHVALVLGLARWVAGGTDERGHPFAGEPLRATFTTPAQRFVVPEASVTIDAASATSASGSADTGLPAPERRVGTQRGGSSVSGQVVVSALGTEDPVDPQHEAVILQIYPGAVRAMLDFETAPTAAYPEAALPERRQAHIIVLVVVLEDGTVELAQGTYDEPLFGPSIKAALAGAKGRPALVDGEPRPIWSPMLFTFEVVGGP